LQFQLPSTPLTVSLLREVHDHLVESVSAHDYQAKYYNTKHKPAELDPGDMA
jgi:hypothetical protein